MVPVASSAVSSRRARPSWAWATVLPAAPSPGVAVSTSPSWSVSLASTGRTVERPGRTPKESSTASGGWFSSVRSGRDWDSLVWAESSLLAASSSVWEVTSVQFSTSTSSSSGSHTVPSMTSLRTMASRLTRKTGAVEEASFSSWRVSVCPEHWRTNWPDPDQAAYTQPPRRTGAAATPTGASPSSEAGRDVEPEPSMLTLSSAVREATRTVSESGPGCWRVRPDSPRSRVLPPGRWSTPVPRSRTTVCAPTAVTATSVPAVSEAASVLGLSQPVERTGTVVIVPVLGDTAWTEPSVPATATTSGSFSIRAGAADREPMALTVVARTVPSEELTEMTRSAPWEMATPLVRGVPVDSETVVGSTVETVEAAVSGTRTWSALWVTSKLSEAVRMAPSTCREG